MIRRRLYTQLVMVFAISLLFFALIASAMWRATGHDQYEGEMFRKTTRLAMLLLPPAESDMALQQEAVNDIGNALEVGITLWSSDKRYVVARGAQLDYPDDLQLKVGSWIPTDGLTTWSTKLPDDRIVVMFLDRLEVPDETTGFVISMLVLAVFITIVSYPFIRRITRRLETLQKQVLMIGEGDLSTRVDVVGTDEIAQLASNFNISAKKIESLVTAQRMLLANASHELRTPLARIKLAIDMLQERDDPERRKAMHADISELDELIDELIMMVRLDTDMQPNEFENVDLIGLAAEECAQYRDCELIGSNGEIRGDPRMLRHVIRNLLDNAYNHGEAPVSVEIDTVNGNTYLTVVDGGEGISEAEREKVFQPFYRAANKQNVPGYGLGFPIIERIVKLHGASIHIDNKPRSAISVIFENGAE